MSHASRARIYRPTRRNIEFLAGRLRAGEVVAIPTETVYGLAANALDVGACQQIFQIKGRPPQDPLIVHISALPQLEQIAHTNATAVKLAKRFWPGPLTVVLPKNKIVPAVVTAGRDSVAIRMPAHPIARRLIARTGVPVAAPSANPFGYISPTTATHVRESLGQKVAHILDGGPAGIGLESTILDLRDPDVPVLLRPGAITKQQLERVLGRSIATARANAGRASRDNEGYVAPGMMARHYSPRTRVVLHERIDSAPLDAKNAAFIFMRKPEHDRAKNVFWFDSRGELRGIARRLFATLRKVDAMNFKSIHVELAPGSGLAEAINDRLRRAAAR